MKEIRKVLVIKLDDLSEFVLALAAMGRIRQAHPRAQITLLTTPPFAGLAQASPYFNFIDATGAGEAVALANAIKTQKFDRVYDLDGSKRTAAIRRWVWPFRPSWSTIGRAGEDHRLERQAAQLKAIGAWPDAPAGPGSAPPPDLAWITSRIPEPRKVPGATKPRPYVILVPGGADGRRWPEDRFGAVAARMRQDGYDVVIVGPPEESALARHIQKSDPKARDLTGRSDYAAIAALGVRAAIAIGNDTGLLHLIAATGTPAIALFSTASHPELSGPRGHVAILQAEKLADLEVDQVLRAVASLAPAPLTIS